MNNEASIERTPAVLRRAHWHRRLQPYQDVLLTGRSLVMWENGFLLAVAAIGIHLALYLLFEFFNRSTFFGLLFSTLGSVFPVLFFARKTDFLKYIKRQPRPDDSVHFETIVNSAAECDALVDWARFQIEQRIDTVNPLVIIGVTFAFSALGALFNCIPTFYVCWFLAQALLFGPGCYVHGMFHRARDLGEQGVQAAVPLFRQLSQSVSASVRAGLSSEGSQQRATAWQQPSNGQPQQEQRHEAQQQHQVRQSSQPNLHQQPRDSEHYIPVPQPHFEQPDYSQQYHTTDQYQQFPSPLPAYLQPSVVSHGSLDPEFLALLTPEERRANGLQ